MCIVDKKNPVKYKVEFCFGFSAYFEVENTESPTLLQILLKISGCVTD